MSIDTDLAEKSVVIILIFLLGVFGGFLPKKVSQRNDRLLSIMNTGSGGVLLAAGFMHLLPDAAETLADEADKIGFPIAYLLSSGGFLLVLFVEELAVEYKESLSRTSTTVPNMVQSGLNATMEALQLRSSLVSKESFTLASGRFLTEPLLGGGQRRHSDAYYSADYGPPPLILHNDTDRKSTAVCCVHVVDGADGADKASLRTRNANNKDMHSAVERGMVGDGGNSTGDCSLSLLPPPASSSSRGHGHGGIRSISSPDLRAMVPPVANRSPGALQASVDEESGHGHGEGHGDGHGHGGDDGHDHNDFSAMLDGSGTLGATVLFMALVLHSILEGLGFGTASGLQVGVLVAISSHKILAAFTLGSSLVRAGVTDRRFAQFIVAFAAVTPLGICLGMAIAQLGDSNIAAYFTALASGTFIYIATTEVLPAELAKPEDKKLKLLALFLGYGVMGMLALWV